MTTLSFSLAPDALIKLHDALTCLAKFHETVSIEAEHDLLRFSVLNSTKTAYSAFVLEADKFFQSYSFSRSNPTSTNTSSHVDRFCCQIYLKALLSVFKGRTSERDKDTAVERCEVDLHEDDEQTKCRLIIRMICGLGVIKSYKLTYEPATIQHAVFDRTRATNQWAIEPKFLKQIIDHFSPSAEQLDVWADANRAIFTSFTTKITEGKEILKQPVHTSVAIDKRDFEQFSAEENLHVAINLKDFKAVIAHAETLNAVIVARYTRPCRPLQLAYDIDGVSTEYTLMTRGEADSEDAPASSRMGPPALSARQTPAPVQFNAQPNDPPAQTHMPPPSSRPIRPLTGSATRPSGTSSENPRPPASIDFDSLFVPADDDRQWDEPNDEDEAEDTLGWDATTDQETFNASLGGRLQDTEPSMASHRNQEVETGEDDMGIPPTQRISQLRGLGLFD